MVVWVTQTHGCLHICVQGGGSERDFICTQAPMRNTMEDFWRMVWEQNVRIIVMVTALRDRDLVRPYRLCRRVYQDLRLHS